MQLIPFLVFLITAEDIMRQVEDLPQPKTSRSEAVMIIRKEGEERTRKMLIMTFQNNERKSVSKFLEPPDVRDTAFLQISKKKGDILQFLYLPSLKKTRRIGEADKSTSFMGSEITYEDMKPREVEKFNWKILDEREDHWIIEAIPKSKDISQYERAILKVGKDFLIYKTELFRDGKKFKEVEVEYQKVKSYNIPFLTKVKNLQNGNETLLELRNIEVDIEIPSKYFSDKYLGQW